VQPALANFGRVGVLSKQDFAIILRNDAVEAEVTNVYDRKDRLFREGSFVPLLLDPRLSLTPPSPHGPSRW
jgi:hypothetical protein